MLKWVRISRSRRHAALILGITDENLQRLPAEPIGFHPGEGIGRMRIEFEGTWYSLTDVAIVHGTDDAALVAWLEANGVNPDAVEYASQHPGEPTLSQPGAPARKH